MRTQIFDWTEYLNTLFENNRALNPHELWDIAVNELTDAEKVQAFNQSAGKSDLSTRRTLWKNTFMKPKEDEPVFGLPKAESGAKPTPTIKPIHAGGSVFDVHSELQVAVNTHNAARTNKWVPLGDWTVLDWKSFEAHVLGMSDTYKSQANYAHEVQEIMMRRGAETTAEVWEVVLDKIGPLG